MDSQDATTAVDPEALNAALAIQADITKLRTAVGWLVFISVFTVVNVVMLLTGSSWRMVAGLLAPRFALRWMGGLGGTAVPLEIAMVSLGAAVFAALAILVQRRSKSALLVAIALYGLDTALFLVTGDFIGLALHGLGVYCMVVALGAVDRLGPIPARPWVAAIDSDYSAFDTED